MVAEPNHHPLGHWAEKFAQGAAGLYALTGENGSGKSRWAQRLEALVPGATLLSAESQQRFYELQLRENDANFNQGRETSVQVREILGDAGLRHDLYGMLNLVGLEERSYFQLSTGEARKVLLLRALLDTPTALILDEPFDGLDRAARHDLWLALGAITRDLPVVLVASLDARELETELGVREGENCFVEVAVAEDGELAFVGPEVAWLARTQRAPRDFAYPPIDDAPAFGFDPHRPLIDLRRATVRYGDHVVFENIDLCVRPGQHTLIEGPNGSGKSSLLSLITGDHPQAYVNDLTLFGRRRGTGESVWDIKRHLGVVSGQLHRDYRVNASVGDVLVSGLYDSIGLYQAVSPLDRTRAQAWYDWVGLRSSPGRPVSMETPFRQLSFGEQRLILVARAAIKVPPLLVLDEPTTGLDAAHRAQVLELVGSLCGQTSATVLFVSHRSDERAFWRSNISERVLSLHERSRSQPAQET